MAKRISRSESRMITRVKLLDSAEEEFSSYGFGAASVDRLTESAGFSRGAFYANFKSKEELFLALVEDRMEVILSDLKTLTDKQTILKKEALLKYYLDRAFDKKLTLLMAEFLISGIRNPKLKSKICALNDRYIHEVAKAIALALGEQIKSKEKQIASVFLAAGQGLMLFYFGNPTPSNRKTTEQAMKLLFERLI